MSGPASGAARRLVRSGLSLCGRRSSTVALWAAGRVGYQHRVGGVLIREGLRRLEACERERAESVLVPVATSTSIETGLRALKAAGRIGEPSLAARLGRQIVGRRDLGAEDLVSANMEVGRALVSVGAAGIAVPYFVTAVQARPDQGRLVRALLEAAAHARDRGVLREYLTRKFAGGLSVSDATQLMETFADEGLSAEMRHLAAIVSVDLEFVRPLLDRDDVACQPDLVRALIGAISSRPAAGRAWAEHARRLERRKAWRDAAKALQVAVELDGSHARWLHRLSYAAQRAGDAGLASWARQRMWELPEAPDPAVRGAVAPLERREIIGWIPPGTGSATEVAFRFANEPVAWTQATRLVTLPDGEEYLEFRRCLRDLWSYAGAGDVLEVLHDGRVLPIVGQGNRHRFSSRRRSRAEELLERIERGDVFDKYGHLRTPISQSAEWQEAIFGLYSRLRRELREGLGVELFPTYGTLLGAVRDSDFIGHDNDFDATYVSRHSGPVAVRDEFVALCRYLVDQGYNLKVKKTHTWVWDPTMSYKLDIFFSWITPEGEFRMSYGHHGPPVTGVREFDISRVELLGDREVEVPANAEQVLLQLFGEGWTEPDPGFKHSSSSRVIDDSVFLLNSQLNDLYWHQFYRDHGAGKPSPFATFADDWLSRNSLVVELGCGSGQDSLHFGRCGHTVIAGDRSQEAIARATEALSEGERGAVRFEVIDAASGDDLRSFFAGVKGTWPERELVLYLRFFLHAVPEDVEDGILEALADTGFKAVRILTEFRTDNDKDLPKVHADHYRRYIDVDEFVEKLAATWGFEIEYVTAGYGLSPYRGEDPHLARVIAARTLR